MKGQLKDLYKSQMLSMATMQEIEHCIEREHRCNTSRMILQVRAMHQITKDFYKLHKMILLSRNNDFNPQIKLLQGIKCSKVLKVFLD